MNTAIALNGSVVIGRRRLGALIAGIAIASGALGGAVVASLPESDFLGGRSTATHDSPQPSLAERWQAQRDDFIDDVAALTPEELAATFGNVTPQRSLSQRWQAQRDDFIDSVVAMTPEELAATFGNTRQRSLP